MAINNYRVDDLRALSALHADGSFVRAAERLFITPSAFSRRIAQLESDVGAPLVERSTRKLVFTPLGAQFLADTAPLLRKLDEAFEQASRCARGEAGRVAFSCLTTVAYALLPPVLQAFRLRFPQVHVHLRDDTGQRVTQAVIARDAEFGVSVLGPPSTELHALPCADDPFVIAFRPGHPLTNRQQVEWQELAQWRVVALRSSSANRAQIDGALSEAGIVSPWADEVEHLSTMLGLLRGGVGIGVLPQLALWGQSADELLTRPLVSPAIARRIGLLRREDARLSVPAQYLWQLLRETLKIGR